MTTHRSFRVGAPLIVDTSLGATTILTNVSIEPSGSGDEYMAQSTSLRATVKSPRTSCKGKGVQRSLDWFTITRDASTSEREKLAYQLLASLPRSRLAAVRRQIEPLLQFDLVGSLPTELSLQIFTLLSAAALLNCSLVSRRWNQLANDQTLWRSLCHNRGWEWRPQRNSPSPRQSDADIDPSAFGVTSEDREEDEGMGDEEEGEDEGSIVLAEEEIHVPNEDVDPDHEFVSMNLDFQNQDIRNMIGQFTSVPSPKTISRSSSSATAISRTFSQNHASLKGPQAGSSTSVDYKLLHQTHALLRSRVRHGAYRLHTLPGAEGGGHTAAVYCLALWSYNSANGPLQVLFTGSKDRTVIEWELSTYKIRRRIVGMHESSVLSLCVTSSQVRTVEDSARGASDDVKEVYKSSEAGVLVSGGSDSGIVVWDLAKFNSIKVLRDHTDSVLCVRTDGRRLISCSKDRTVRTYTFPWLKPEWVLRGHRAAVNAVSVAGDVIVSGSGDRSIRVWDARSGTSISHFEEHHGRAISSVELSPPFILSGSSDRHLRMTDMRTKRGWSTSPEFDNPTTGQPLNLLSIAPEGLNGSAAPSGSSVFLHSSLSQSFQQSRQNPNRSDEARICGCCGARVTATGTIRGPERHSHPVRSVVVGDEFAVSGSYDCTVKVWDKATGALVADLTKGHTGRVFCVAQDSTKIVSCGEDQRICIWDFSHGIDTSFIKL